ncbi:hypothetical protein ACP3V3_02130 [Vibrio sp. PNB22_3_1]
MKMNLKALPILFLSGLLMACVYNDGPVVQANSEPANSDWSNRPEINALEELPPVTPVTIDDGVELPVAYDARDRAYFDLKWFDNLPEHEKEYWLTVELDDPDLANAKLNQPVVLDFDGGAIFPAESDDVIVYTSDGADAEFQRFNKRLRGGESASYIAQSSTYIIDSGAIGVYSAYRGETFSDVLSRWLSAQGYKVVGWYLEVLPESLMGNAIPESINYEMSFQDAVADLFDVMKSQEVIVDRVVIDSDDVEDVKIEVRLDEKRGHAIVTSSDMPTTLFFVEPGSLKDNFVRLGEHFGWVVDEDFFLAKDYGLSFGYPIVSEKDNVKGALEQLLRPFSSLRGVMVPSVREIYVVEEQL